MGNTAKGQSNSKKSTGIVVALPRELMTLGYNRPPEKDIIQHSNHLSIALSGMGRENATRAAEQLVQNGAHRLVSWGTATALVTRVKPGTLAVPETIITENRKEIPTNEDFRKAILEQLSLSKSIVNGPLASVNEVLSGLEQKLDTFENTLAPIADMESAGVAGVAQKYDLPFAAVRAVSDSAEMVIPKTIFSNTTEDGFADTSGIVKQAIVTPKDWLPMILLSYNFSKARKTLSKAAKDLLSYLNDTG